MKTQRSHFIRQIMHSEQLARARHRREEEKSIKKYTIAGWSIAIGYAIVMIICLVL